MAKKQKKEDVAHRYDVVTLVDSENIEGEGVLLNVKHSVHRDRKLIQNTDATWVLEEEVAAAFVEALEENELLNQSFFTEKFGDVAKCWKRITKFLEKINRMAEKVAKELDK